MSFEVNSNSTYNYGIDIIGDENTHQFGDMSTGDLHRLNTGSSFSTDGGFTMLPDLNDDVFGIYAAPDEAGKSDELENLLDDFFDFEAASGKSGSSNNGDDNVSESYGNFDLAPLPASEQELNINTEISDCLAISTTAFQEPHVLNSTIEPLDAGSQGSVWSSDFDDHHIQNPTKEPSGSNYESLDVPAGYTPAQTLETQSITCNENAPRRPYSPFAFINGRIQKSSMEDLGFIGTPAAQPPALGCADDESRADGYVHASTPVNGHPTVANTVIDYIDAENHFFDHVTDSSSAFEYSGVSYFTTKSDTYCGLTAVGSTTPFGAIEDSAAQYAPAACPAAELAPITSSPPSLDVEAMNALIVENAHLRALFHNRSGSPISPSSPAKTPTKQGSRSKPKTPAKKTSPPVASPSSTRVKKPSASRARKPSSSSAPINSLTRAGAATPKSGLSAAARAILDTPSELTSLWGDDASILRRRNFYSLTQEEKARLLLPMLQGMGPEEIDGAVGANPIHDADKAVIMENAQAFGIGVGGGGTMGELVGYGATRQREALRRAEVLGASGRRR